MTAPHHLEASLRTLRLSGMLDTLGARLDQARAGELGHLEFLQVLCEDEVARRAATALARRVRAARFEQTYTLEDFGFAYNPNIPAGLIRDLAAGGPHVGAQDGRSVGDPLRPSRKRPLHGRPSPQPGPPTEVRTVSRYLVIGGAGRTGRLVVDRLANAGHQVTVALRRPIADFYGQSDIY